MAFDASGLYIDRGVYNNSVTPTQLGQHSYKGIDNLETTSSTIIPYFPPYLGSTPENVLVGDTILLSCPDGFGRFVILETAPTLVLAPQEIDSPVFEHLTLTNITQNDADTKILALNSVTDAVEWRDVATFNPFDQDLNTTDDVNFNSVTLPSVDAPVSSPLNFYSESQIIPLTFSGPFTTPVDVDCIATRVGNMVTLEVPRFSGFCTIPNQAIFSTAFPAWITQNLISNTIVYPRSASENGYPIIVNVGITDTPGLIISKGSLVYWFLADGGDLTIDAFTLTYLI